VSSNHKPFDDRYLLDQGWRLIEPYAFTDASGAVLYEKLRYHRPDPEEPKGYEKTFRLRRPNGNGSWCGELGDVPRVLYRLRDLRSRPGDECHVTEGEKAANRIASLGLLATCVAAGWTNVDLEPLRGRPIIIHQDNDQPGEDKATATAEVVSSVAKSVRIVKYPDVDPHNDVYDWLDANNDDVARLKERCEAAPLYSGQDQPAPLVFINIGSWEGAPVPPREWAVHDRIPANAVTGFSGHGGTGKSLISMTLAAAHVLARDWFGSLPEPGPVIYFSTEDDGDEMHRRFTPIAERYHTSFTELSNGGLHLIDRVGQEAFLGYTDKRGIIQPTPLLDQLHEAACDLKPVHVIIDALADVYAGKENDRAQARQFISLLRSLARSARTAITLISHPSLAGMQSGSGLSGSTDWHNAVRARMYLTTAKTGDGSEPDPDLRVLEIMKNNYGPTGERIMIRWRDGLFVPEVGPSSLEQMATAQRADNTFLEMLAVFTEQNRNVTANQGPSYAPSEFAAHPRANGVRRAEFKAAMDRLLASNKIRNEAYGPPSKRRTKLVRT
jgi:RecA-family ATPase